MKVTILGPSKTIYNLYDCQTVVSYDYLEETLQIYPITELVTVRSQVFKTLVEKYSKQIKIKLKTFDDDKETIDYGDMVVLFYNPKLDHLSHRLRKIKKYLKKINKITIIKDYKERRCSNERSY